MKKILTSILVGLSLLIAPSVSAHVVVKPAEVGVATFQTFIVGVLVEKDNPTVGLRLVIPAGVKSVTPNAKPGWQIVVKKTGEGEEVMVSEISWTGGVIPVGQREEFLFSAQVPATESTLTWKAYQTYQNGEIVAWEHDPAYRGAHEDETKAPYSQTKIINDLKIASPMEMTSLSDEERRLPLILSGLAFVLSVAALGLVIRRV